MGAKSIATILDAIEQQIDINQKDWEFYTALYDRGLMTQEQLNSKRTLYLNKSRTLYILREVGITELIRE